MQKFYAGVGSRKVPDDILLMMVKIALQLEKQGLILRSGGAIGSDLAFEAGAREHKEIILAKDPVSDKAYEIAERIHPAWNRMGKFGKGAHARNICQVFGLTLDKPVEFVICWTPNGKKVGGTRTAIVCAEENQIPVYNLAIKKDLKTVMTELL